MPARSSIFGCERLTNVSRDVVVRDSRSPGTSEGREGGTFGWPGTPAL